MLRLSKGILEKNVVFSRIHAALRRTALVCGESISSVKCSRGANLSDSILVRVGLTGAKLDNANLFGTVLSDSDFWCCATEDIKEYVELLSNVKTLYLAKLLPGVEAILRKERPHLFEKPTDDK